MTCGCTSIGHWKRDGEDARDAQARPDPETAPRHREDERLDEELHQDVERLGPERHAQADLARSLGDAHEHDVHDPDAADQQRDRGDARQQGRHRIGPLLPRARDLAHVADGEIVVVARREVVAITEQRRDVLLGATDVLGRRRLDVDGPLQVVVEASLDLPLVGRDRDERGVVVVLPARRLPLGDRDAHDREGRARDPHALADRIRVGAEELLHHGLAQHHDLRSGVDVLPGDADARLHRPVADIEVVGRGPGDARGPVRVVADQRLGGAQRRGGGLHGRHLGPERLEVVLREGRLRPEAAALSARGRRSRQDDEQVRPHRGERLLDLRLRPRPDGHHRDDRADADDDPEGGQERAQLVAQDGPERHAKGLPEVHAGAMRSTTFGVRRSSERTRPSLTKTTRDANSATSGSCVTRMIVIP